MTEDRHGRGEGEQMAAAIEARALTRTYRSGHGVFALNFRVEEGGVLSMGAVMAAFLFVVAAYSALFSAFSSDRGRAAGLAGGLSLAFYLAWVISRLSPDWS